MFGSGPQKFTNPNDQMHPQDRRNLIIFIILSLCFYLAFDHFVMRPKIAAIHAQQEVEKNLADKKGSDDAVSDKIVTRDAAIGPGQRIKLDNGAVSGTISLTGNRVDDVMLNKYFQTLGGSDRVPVLSPLGTAHPKYAEFGWIHGDDVTKVPDKDSTWTVNGNKDLSKDHPVTMAWSNGQGLTFERTFSIDDKYVIAIKQRVINNGAATVKLYPYALVAEIGLPDGYIKQNVVFQGPTGYIGEKLYEYKYKNMDDKGEESFSAAAGWIGITEKYWLASLIPQQGETVKYTFHSTVVPDTATLTRRYQVDTLGALREIAPGASAESTTSLFAGAKEVRVLDAYEDSLPAPHFDLAVDFGLYYFLTKPFFFILSTLGHWTGNFGIAIIIFTVMLRGAMYPLNNTSYRSFAKMKKIGPEMSELRKKYADNKEVLQKELVALYTREKVNPAAGCLPILLQIPIFFALYKVLSVTIEMRHAPFYGWVHDLSAADPTSVFNLFGLLPFEVPAALMIGAWPCLMLAGMLLQRSMNPPPQDPVQAQMVKMMPFFMTFVMAKFAAGLVIYWTFSNILSVAQQYIITRRMGVEVHFFHRTPAEKELEKQVLSGPNIHPELEMIEEEIEGTLPNVTSPKPRRKKKR